MLKRVFLISITFITFVFAYYNSNKSTATSSTNFIQNKESSNFYDTYKISQEYEKIVLIGKKKMVNDYKKYLLEIGVKEDKIMLEIGGENMIIMFFNEDKNIKEQ